MSFSTHCNRLFWDVVIDYHVSDNVDTPIENPYPQGTMDHDLYQKAWGDAVQWHLEDLIRDPKIAPEEALALKRRIDQANQTRTEMVEALDSYFYTKFHQVEASPNATLNTESPAWALDRLAILTLKIYHMQVEAVRLDASAEHRAQCQRKLNTLLEQRVDLSTAIDQLLEAYAAGTKRMKMYKQMKMYNDPTLNPVLYREQR